MGRQPVTTRECGQCKLCCKVLPVPEIDKLSNVWCQHAKGAGCAIYSTRPRGCRTWSCFWLTDATEKFPDLRRPDKAHYVIDEGADIVKVDGKQIGVAQIWADPGYPAAWRSDEALQRFIRILAQNGSGTLIRRGADLAVLILNPPLAPECVEITTGYTRGPTSDEDKAEFFGEDRILRRQ